MLLSLFGDHVDASCSLLNLYSHLSVTVKGGQEVSICTPKMDLEGIFRAPLVSAYTRRSPGAGGPSFYPNPLFTLHQPRIYLKLPQPKWVVNTEGVCLKQFANVFRGSEFETVCKQICS